MHGMRRWQRPPRMWKTRSAQAIRHAEHQGWMDCFREAGLCQRDGLSRGSLVILQRNASNHAR